MNEPNGIFIDLAKLFGAVSVEVQEPEPKPTFDEAEALQQTIDERTSLIQCEDDDK